MLQRMRSSTGSWIAKGILGLLVLSFLGWGVADYTTTGLVGNVTAKVGDREIGINEFYTAYNRFLQTQRLTAVDPDLAREMRLADAVLNNLTTSALYDAEAAARNLTASDQMIRRDIETRPEFQGSDGSFNRNAFDIVLGQNGLTEQTFVETSRRELARGLLVNAVTSGSDAPTDLVDMLFEHYGERRSTEYMILPISSVSVSEEVDEESLRSFFEVQQEDFRRPELRSLTYVLISPELLAEGMEISEEDLTAAFEERRASFEQPEIRDIAQIMFPDEATAKEAATALQAVGADEIAAKAEELELTVIDLGAFTQDGLPNAGMADAAFGIAEPGATDAFEGAFGWSIAIVRNIQEGVEPTLEDLRDTLTSDIALDRAYDAVQSRGNELEDYFGQGSTLEEAATSAELNATTIQAVDASGRDPSGTALEGLPAGLTFLRTAFELEQGDVSFLETTEANAMFMVRVDTITPAAIPEFESVTDEVKAAWLAESRYDAAELRAETLAERLTEGADLSVLATIMQAETATIASFARDGQNDTGIQMPQPLARQLFDLNVGEAGYDVDGENFIIARVTGMTEATEAADDAFRDTLSGVVSVGMAQDLIEQLGTALRARHDITTYPEVYEQVYR